MGYENLLATENTEVTENNGVISLKVMVTIKEYLRVSVHSVNSVANF